MAKTKSGKTVLAVPLFVLRITLCDSNPPIWRRVVVPSDISLGRLHYVIQTVMGWDDSHMHEFLSKNARFRNTDIDPDLDEEIFDEKQYAVADLVKRARQKFYYEYDFGDDWLHEIVLEKVLKEDSGAKPLFCLDGARACPPDDCGGVYGYEDMLEILANPSHEEHQNLKDWVGGNWDAEHFDIAEVNAELHPNRTHPPKPVTR